MSILKVGIHLSSFKYQDIVLYSYWNSGLVGIAFERAFIFTTLTVITHTVTPPPPSAPPPSAPPPSLPQVRTKLAHPTNFHVNEIQKRQVSKYLSSSTSPIQHSRSAPLQNLRGLNIHPGMLNSVGGGGMAKKDPLLSGSAASGGSPMKTSNSFTPQMGNLGE